MTSVDPSSDTMGVEGMIAHSPCNSAIFFGGSANGGLAFDAFIHKTVPADSTSICYNIPGPKSDTIPRLYDKLGFGRINCIFET